MALPVLELHVDVALLVKDERRPLTLANVLDRAVVTLNV